MDLFYVEIYAFSFFFSFVMITDFEFEYLDFMLLSFIKSLLQISMF